MEKMIAYCGLVCTECPAYLATQKDDADALEKVARQWSKQFDVSLQAEDCYCDGCQATTDRLFGYCHKCKIRACGLKTEVTNCAHCGEYACEELEGFFKMAPEAKTTLEKVRRVL